MAPPARLPPVLVEQAMRRSVPEGALWALMAGASEIWFVADAVRLGAGPLELALVVTLPFAGGAVGSLVALRLLARTVQRKPVVLFGVALQIVGLLTLAALHASHRMATTHLIVLAFLHQLAGQCAGAAWSAWIGDLVPAPVRGRYFARRSRYVHLATFASMAAAGVFLQGAEPGSPGAVVAGAGGAGYGVLFACAAGARLLSGSLLLVTPEPAAPPIPSPVVAWRFLRTGRGRATWRLLGFAGLMQFAVYLAAPYFGPYMLDDLQFSYVEYMTVTGAVVAAKVLVLPAWGHSVDLYGARPVLALAAVLVAIVPLPWVWAQGVGWVLFAQTLSGFSWGGHEVGYFSLVLESTYKRARLYVFAAQNVVHALGQVVGGLVAAGLLERVAHDSRLLFGGSAIARLVVALLLPALVPPIRTRPTPGRGALLLRVVGLRPHGGLVHRPLPASDPTPVRPAPRSSS